jgi:hypothetical protein
MRRWTIVEAGEVVGCGLAGAALAGNDTAKRGIAFVVSTTDVNPGQDEAVVSNKLASDSSRCVWKDASGQAEPDCAWYPTLAAILFQVVAMVAPFGDEFPHGL